MSADGDKALAKLADLERDAEVLVQEVRLAVQRATPALLKLKWAQFEASPQKVYALRALLNTDSMEGSVKNEVREVIMAAVYGALYA